jgi:outer membrane biosynthesis protein TonB
LVETNSGLVKEASTMRLDYGLYGVAIICFLIAVAFAASAVPGYTTREIGGIAVIIVFLILGIISGVVGYSARPKTIIPTTIQPTPTSSTLEAPTASATPTPEPLPPASPQEIPSPPPTSQSPPTEEVPSETLTPEPHTPPQLEETAVAPPTETEPTKVIEEEKPKEKRVRRRRQKTR